MSWMPIRSKYRWICDHCRRCFRRKDVCPHIRQRHWMHRNRPYDHLYYKFVWEKAHPRDNKYRSYGIAHYCSDECAQPYDAEEVRLALRFDEDLG